MGTAFRKSNNGSVVIELALFAIVFCIVTVISIDIARLFWVRSVIQDALVEGIKTAQGLNSEESYVNLAQISTGSSKNSLQETRKSAVQAVLKAPLMNQLSQSVTFYNFRHNVNSLKQTQLPIAYLFPGAPSGCWVDPNSNPSQEQCSEHKEFSQNKSADLKNRIPLELTAKVSVPGIIFSFTTEVSASGYLPNARRAPTQCSNILQEV